MLICCIYPDRRGCDRHVSLFADTLLYLQILQVKPVSDPDAFVEVIDGEFVLGCETFPISGINAW